MRPSAVVLNVWEGAVAIAPSKVSTQTGFASASIAELMRGRHFYVDFACTHGFEMSIHTNFKLQGKVGKIAAAPPRQARLY